MLISTAWHHLLDDILNYGIEINKDGVIVKEGGPVRFWIDSALISMPAVIRDPKLFLTSIQNGVFDIDKYPIKGEALADYVGSFEDMDVISLSRDFVYSYPERILDYMGINQFEIIKERLIENPESNRAVITLYNPKLDGCREDIPCLNHLQAQIRRNQLRLSCLFRSNDIYGAFCSNMLFLQYIGIKLAYELQEEYPGLEFSGINYMCNSPHIYKTDLDMAKKVIER